MSKTTHVPWCAVELKSRADISSTNLDSASSNKDGNIGLWEISEKKLRTSRSTKDLILLFLSLSSVRSSPAEICELNAIVKNQLSDESAGIVGASCRHRLMMH
eukprot:g16574.t1